MRGVLVVIQRCTLLTNFVVLMMGEFNAIFVVDWLMRHRVLIDFKKKKVQHHLSQNERVTFKGKGRSSIGSLIVFQKESTAGREKVCGLSCQHCSHQ